MCVARHRRRKVRASMRSVFDETSASAFAMPGTTLAACASRQPGSVDASWRTQWNAATRVFCDFSLSWRTAALTTRGTSASSSAAAVAPASSTAIASTPISPSGERVTATCIIRSLNVANTSILTFSSRSAKRPMSAGAYLGSSSSSRSGRERTSDESSLAAARRSGGGAGVGGGGMDSREDSRG